MNDSQAFQADEKEGQVADTDCGTQDTRYGLDNWLDAYRRTPSVQFQTRRAIADRLSAISTRLIRADLPLERLQSLEQQLLALETSLADVPVCEHRSQSTALWMGQATQDNVLMGFDYDAVTGACNPAAPRISFDVDSDEVIAHVTLGELHEGGPGNAHGGVLAAMLDVVLARVQHAQGWIGVTGSFDLRYLQPTPLHVELTLKAFPASRVGRVTRVKGGVWVGDVQTVEAEAVFVASKVRPPRP